MTGIIIPFPAKRRARSAASGEPAAAGAAHVPRTTLDAMAAAPDQQAVLAAAGALLDHCRDRYGFVVMQNGLPADPAVLGGALLALFRALAALDRDVPAGRTVATYGVYFGRPHLMWFEDGYGGMSALAVPDRVDPADLAAFIRPRLVAERSTTAPEPPVA